MPSSSIEWLFPDGSGGARLDRGVVRIPGALPGDQVRWRADGGRETALVGALEAIERPSPDRVTPPCPWDATCGGCDLSALSGPGRLAALSRVAARAFGVDVDPPFVPSPRSEGHRARIKLAIDGAAVGFRSERSHVLVPIDVCRVARPEVVEALGRLRPWVAEHGAGLETVEIRSDGARAMFAFTSNGPVKRAAFAALGDVALDGAAIAGEPTLTLTVAGHALRASPRSFYQVNLEVNERLVACVAGHVAAIAPERVLDLYSGIGNLTLPIAALGVPVVAVEREGQATADLRANDRAWTARRPKRSAIEVVEVAVERLDVARVAFDVVVLDPPRAGAPGVLERVTRQRPKGIVYVACDPVNAARDVRPLLKQGYRIASIECFDMFPETRHFETVIVLRRGNAA